jgi:hypothetical protein
VRPFILLAAALALTPACAKSKTTKVIDELADQVCACKDLDCAMKAGAAAAKQLEKMRDDSGGEAAAKEVEAANKRIEACMNKLVSAAPAAPATAAPAPAPSGPAAPTTAATPPAAVDAGQK